MTPIKDTLILPSLDPAKDIVVLPSLSPIPDTIIVRSGVVKQVEVAPYMIPLLATEEGELVITEDGYCIDLTRIYE